MKCQEDYQRYLVIDLILTLTHKWTIRLAKWITHKTNPLTYRVHVNRVWMHLFGKGILDSFDNFGILGGEPTNLKLMNYLSTNLSLVDYQTRGLLKLLS